MRLNQRQALHLSREVCRASNGVLNGRILDAYLYGSYVRGDYHDDSDIDILDEYMLFLYVENESIHL